MWGIISRIAAARLKMELTFVQVPKLPDFIKCNQWEVRECVVFHHENSPRTRACWGLGLLISSILLNTQLPFDWMEQGVQMKLNEFDIKTLVGALDQENTTGISTQTLRRSRVKICPTMKRIALQKAWRMVKKHLLRVNPNKRKRHRLHPKKNQKRFRGCMTAIQSKPFIWPNLNFFVRRKKEGC